MECDMYNTENQSKKWNTDHLSSKNDMEFIIPFCRNPENQGWGPFLKKGLFLRIVIGVFLPDPPAPPNATVGENYFD